MKCNGSKKILIVDDEEVILNIMKRKFERLGFDVATACRGEEALEILLKERVDLILADMQIPDYYSGYDILRISKQQQPHASFVLMSGQILSEDSVKDIIKDGAAMFIRKPFPSLASVTQEIADLVAQ